MKKYVALEFALVMLFFIVSEVTPITAFASDRQEMVSGKSYDLGEKDKYDLTNVQEVSDAANRFYVKGDISSVGTQNGFVSYAVNSGNLKLMVDVPFGRSLFEPGASMDWHIITDKTKVVDSTKLSENIGSGAVIVQISKDGNVWINADTEADIYNKMDTINNRTINGEVINAFYETTNVQLTNGCYYRIIVAYKLQREVASSQILLWDKKNYEEKKRVEIYQFYAYDPSVSKTETLEVGKAYEFGEVYRVDSQDGFKNPVLLKADDPHIDWSIGKFYVSGYTAVKMDGDVPVFLKVPEDRAALWFNLEQELNKCNGRTDVQVNNIASGSDIYFGTPTIDNFGCGALIVRKTDYQNKSEREIYTNYLEASATVGANTRVDLFEEGDYEVALDYQLHYDKPFVFGATTTKTLTYRIFFKFKVRNGDISAFLRDVDTNQFITNANVAEQGFYIDVAQSHYLDMTIKREVLTESLNGLVEDTKFSGVAKENRNYTDEGIYTVTIKNLATGDSVQKTVYVGNRDIMLAHMKTGLPLSEINERIAAGAYIDDGGNIIDPEPVVEEKGIVEETEVLGDETEEVLEEIVEASVDQSKEQEEEAVSEDAIESVEAERATKVQNKFVIFAIAVVLCIAGGIALKKRNVSRSFVKTIETETDDGKIS